MRPGDRNVSDGLVDLEKLQAMGGELLAEDRSDLEWEPALVLPYASKESSQLRATQAPRCDTIQSVGFNWLDNVILVVFTEMLLDSFHIAQPQRLGHIQAQILPLPALVLDPFLYHLFLPHDFHPSFINFEGHSLK